MKQDVTDEKLIQRIKELEKECSGLKEGQKWLCL